MPHWMEVGRSEVGSWKLEIGGWRLEVDRIDPLAKLIEFDQSHIITRGYSQDRSPIDPRGDRVVDPQRAHILGIQRRQQGAHARL